MNKILDIRRLGPHTKKRKRNKGFRVMNLHGQIVVVEPFWETIYTSKKKRYEK